MGNIQVDFKELEKFVKGLERARDKEIKKLLEKITNDIALRLLRKVIKRTPVDKGTLRRSWNISRVRQYGNKYEVTVFNPIEYATYVEYGHRQTPGRFVPSIGKRIKKSWIEGKFMLTKSELEIKDRIPAILEKKIAAWLKEVFG